MAIKQSLELISPGEILKEEFMVPVNLSANRLAQDLGVPVNRITDIIRSRRSITADTALRLEQYFGMDAQFWLNLQSSYDLRVAKKSYGKEIKTSIIKRAA